jgi:hypothetical protein
MNERIQELAWAAEDYAESIVDQGGGFHQAYTRKFAELIVEKCAQASEVYWNDAGLQRAFSPSEYIYTILEVE